MQRRRLVALLDLAGGANDVLATADMQRRSPRVGSCTSPTSSSMPGVICIHAVRADWGEDKLEESLLAIGDRVARITKEADRTGRTPWRSPRRWRHTGWVGPSARWAD